MVVVELGGFPFRTVVVVVLKVVVWGFPFRTIVVVVLELGEVVVGD